MYIIVKCRVNNFHKNRYLPFSEIEFGSIQYIQMKLDFRHLGLSQVIE